MSTRCVLLMGDKELALETGEGAPTAKAKGATCPACGVPLRVLGNGRRIGGHDFYTSNAFCAACRAQVGEVRAYVSTVFGLEEDERVLHGRCRVYDGS